MRHSCRFVLQSLCLLSVSVGCAADTTGPTSVDPARLYYQLTLNHHAITLALTAPYNTLQLSALAQSATGASVVDTGRATYTVLNGDINITVNSAGLLTAVGADYRAKVVASRTIGNVTHVDTAFVNVNDVSPIPAFAAIKFDPEPGDSARSTLVGGFDQSNPTVTTYAMDNSGDSIPNVLFRYVYSIAEFTGGFSYRFPYLSPHQPGVFPIVAEATIYGTSRSDTLLYSVGWPLKGEVSVFPSTLAGHVTPIGIFGPHDDTVAVGATVTWVNTLDHQPIDVVFETPSAVQTADSAGYINNGLNFDARFVVPVEGGGDIAPFIRDSVCMNCSFADTSEHTKTIGYIVRARKFSTAGKYPYHSTLYGSTGSIVVLPEFQGLPLHEGVQ